MSIQFGKWNFDCKPLTPEYSRSVGELLAPYGPDSNDSFSGRGIYMLYRAFHTTNESWHERQPYISSSGSIFLWDGRLDNRDELLRELPDGLKDCTDVTLISTAFQQWGVGCFKRLIGDWALSVWEPLGRSLILAKDPIGTRHLYYLLDRRQVTWSTILDPLVFFAEQSFKLSEEYLAGYFVSLTDPHLTPYEEIRSVPPACFVAIRFGCHRITKYWDFDHGKKIRYCSNGEYEEHFRAVFSNAVRRRLRSDRPVLAELSGGMDSSAIVCIADWMFARGEASTPGLDTISYYDDLDPALDERSYLIKVEEQRGRSGYHIDVGRKRTTARSQIESAQFVWPRFDGRRLTAIPHVSCNLLPEVFDEYASHLRSGHYRVTLSGSSGEDVTGGYVPSPKLELQDLILRGRMARLCRQLGSWASITRNPRSLLLREAFLGLVDGTLTFPWAPKTPTLPFWFQAQFIDRNRKALCWYPSKLRIFGGLPSFQNQVHLLKHQQRFLATSNLRPELLREIRYPYLDRDLLEFACAIPREQLVGVGKRRFLMKRALAGIVPDEVLNRKRTIPPTRSSQRADSTDWSVLEEPGHQFITAQLGIIDPALLLEALQRARRNEEVCLEYLRRTVLLEYWLRHLASRGILKISSPAIEESKRATHKSNISAPTQVTSSAS